MKRQQRNLDALDRQIITNELVKDAQGNVIAEEVTCETSVSLPVLKMASNDDTDDYMTFVENNRPSARA